tara:strand:- start:26564 stop:26680 length:117 start_codon:yes stop_codon:yes gene_type:complete
MISLLFVDISSPSIPTMIYNIPVTVVELFVSPVSNGFQ